jgi:2-iminoacetate synthase
MGTLINKLESWTQTRIREDEITPYLKGGEDFIPDSEIERLLCPGPAPAESRVREILSKSLSLQSLTPGETAELMRVASPDLWDEMKHTGLSVKRKVYDNRIVTFAPLYLGNACVNDCLYCGFRKSNDDIERVVQTPEEIRKEVEVLAGKIGHKRLVLVFGEHPDTGIDYILESIRTVYSVHSEDSKGAASRRIRRVSINAAPFNLEELRRLAKADIATYQVFQETYHRETYRKLHPPSTPKGHFRWRLFTMHRALEAGIQDVSIGALFGLADWRFEVLGLVHHARELESRFGIGPHTVSFPRLEPALNTPYAERSPHRVTNEIYLKILTLIRLSLPTVGMVVTAREKAAIRQEALERGITQQDASSNVGVGAYQKEASVQEGERQQFFLGDTRSLPELVKDLLDRGTITSFCTMGYRCGRTGKNIQDAMKDGREAEFCKLNAVLTFREWVDDFAPEKLKTQAEFLLRCEIGEIRTQLPRLYPHFMQVYEKVKRGERDIHF